MGLDMGEGGGSQSKILKSGLYVVRVASGKCECLI